MEASRRHKKAVAAKRYRYRRALGPLKSDIIDTIGPVNNWPVAIKRMFFSDLHPRNMTRFTLTVFMLTNMIPPEWVKKWFDMAYILDEAAKRQIRWVIEKFPEGRWRQWNVRAGRSE